MMPKLGYRISCANRNRRLLLLQLASVAVFAALLSLGESPVLADDSRVDVVLTVDPEPRQRITQWGMSAQHRPDWGKQYTIGQHPASMGALFSDMGASMLRVHIDYATFDNVKRREHLRDILLKASERNMAWYGTPWSPPPSMKTIDHPNGRVKGEINRLAEGREADVAAWLVDLIGWLESEGVPLPYAISPQNEPDWPPPGYPGCIYTAEQIRTAVIELRKQFDAAGYQSVRVVADEGGSPASTKTNKPGVNDTHGTLETLGLTPGGSFYQDQPLQDALFAITTHTYDIHNKLYERYPGYLKDFYDATHKLDAELWMTEWETRHEHTFSDWEILSETLSNFNRDLNSLGFNAWMHWQVWRGWPITPEPEDTGEVVRRIRAGDVLRFDGVEFGQGSQTLTLRVGSDSKNLKLSIHLDDVETQPIATFLLDKTPSLGFTTKQVTIPKTTGTHDVYLRFHSDEHWREGALNWFSIANQHAVEAEAYSDKNTTVKWSSEIMPAYDVRARAELVYDDGKQLQRRPLYYLTQAIWTRAPADGQTRLKWVTSDRPELLQGATREASPQSFRQDVTAFQTKDHTLLVILNRQSEAISTRIDGLSGQVKEALRYTHDDASTTDQPMDKLALENRSTDHGKSLRLELPAESITLLVVAESEPSEK